jgi:hypothetical protein
MSVMLEHIALSSYCVVCRFEQLLCCAAACRSFVVQQLAALDICVSGCVGQGLFLYVWWHLVFVSVSVLMLVMLVHIALSSYCVVQRLAALLLCRSAALDM